MRTALLVPAFLAFLASPPAAASPADEAADFAARIEAAAAAYEAGGAEGASAAIGEAFLDFEASDLDARLAATDPAAYRELERRWLAVRTKIREGASPAEVSAEAAEVAAEIRKLGGVSASASPAKVFGMSFLIILREGMEAILILAALAAYLRKAGRDAEVSRLWGGAACAVAASFVLFGAVRSAMLSIGGAGREAIEGVTMLLAAVVLTYVAHFLLSKLDAARWQAYLKKQIDRAAGESPFGARWAIPGAAFLVVFREGFETVLFYEALAISSGGWTGNGALVVGFLFGCLLLVATGWAVLVAGRRLPLKPFFLTTGTLLFLMAVKFAGDGVAELQEADWVEVSRVAIPSLGGIGALLGIHPTRETLLAQATLLSASVLVYLVARGRAGVRWARSAVVVFALAGAFAAGRAVGLPPVGTSSAAPSAEAKPLPPADPERGRAVYAANCLPCHGKTGRGDGYAAEGLNPPPRNLREAVPMLDDATLDRRIEKGLPGTAMPAFAGVLGEEDRRALIAYLRRLSDAP